ncbi:MAG: hypothetical protein SGJ27_21545 [Candidatus Melainabacteria bacterium]|nr:hypothetical protein [Candidatus Melainabacteria bacterium]
MRFQRSLTIGLITTCLSIAAWIAVPDMALAQESPTISTVTLQVVPGKQGGESVVTPKGMVVPLPGPGVNSGTIQIYMGSQGGFWYVDKNGQNVDLTSYVEQLRSMAGGQQQPTQPVPQYAPAPAPVVVNNQQTTGSSGYGAAGMMGTAAAAGLGAMAGAAISEPYYGGNHGYYGNVPYGSPVHYGAGAKPYYVNGSGNTVNVNHSYTGATVNQTNVNAAKFNENDFNNVHASNTEAQAKWYQNQQKANPAQYQAWQQSAGGANPFVNNDAQARYGAAAAGQTGRHGATAAGGEAHYGAAAEGGAGRFGGAAAGGEAGRFGGAAAEGGGRFGRGAEGGAAGAGAAGAAGGRFGGRFGGGAGAEGGGRFRRGGR